ncbi:MAG: ABC transporter permease [Candidatus Methylomirabilales bacterium]
MGVLAVFKKEIRSYFFSPVAYAIWTVFLLILGYFFYSIVWYFSLVSLQASANPALAQGLNVTDGILRPLFGNVSVVMLFLVPLFTMRLFAEERKQGSLELLMTYPVRDGEILLGKFFAAVALVAVLLSPTLIYVGLLAAYTRPEFGPTVTAYLGVILLATAFIAVGLLISSLTENQIVAAVWTFGILLLLWVLNWIGTLGEGAGARMLQHLSLLNHLDSFNRGILDSRDLVFYLNFTLVFLFLTLKSLEIRRWKG